MRRREHDSEVVLGTARVLEVSLSSLSLSTIHLHLLGVNTFRVYSGYLHFASFIRCIVSIKHFTQHVYNISHLGLSSAAMHESILLLSLVRQMMAESAELLYGIEWC